MIVEDIPALKRSLSKNQRLLGLDVGSKTIGIAISDAEWRIATPLLTIARKKLSHDAAALQKLCTERLVGGLVIGLPVNMNGTEGPMCQSIRQFAVNITPHLSLPVLFQDERLTSAASFRSLSAFDISKDRLNEVVDKVAASYILQTVLDRMAHMSAEHGGEA